MSYPKISIVMPSFNQAAFIEESIESIEAQDYADWELIVIDGGSTDGTVDIIRRHEKNLAYWVSEPDRGQSHALNKGFARATGELLAWLNSDDVLLPGALAKVAEAARQTKNRKYCWIAGGHIWMDPEGRVMKCTRTRPWWPPIARGWVSVFGPSSFFSRELLEAAGPIDEDLHFMMDTELWMRFSRHGARYRRVPGYLWGFRWHPDGKTTGHNFAHSPMAAQTHPAWEGRRREKEKVRSAYIRSGLDERYIFLIDRLRLIVSPQSYHSWVETLRFKGKPWRNVFLCPGAAYGHAKEAAFIHASCTVLNEEQS